MKLIFKLVVITFIGIAIVACYELISFATDDQFWNSIPEVEEAEYHREYERFH